jgi:hypothetical protein
VDGVDVVRVGETSLRASSDCQAMLASELVKRRRPMKKYLASAALAAALMVGATFTSAAQAQDEKGGAAPAGATTYDFEDDLVTGDLVRPDGELLSVRRRGNRASLIQIREHFIPEMLKSIEDL